MDQLNELHDEGAKFLDTNPYGLRFEHYLDQGTGQRRVRALLAVREQPSLGYGIVLGEAVYHTRGVLDHLVYQLALLNTSRPRGTQFPLATDETVYRTASPGKKSPRDAMLGNVREEHRAIIDSYQPYQDGPLAKQNRLYVLGQFANSDKHRVIQVAYGVPDAIKVEPTAEGVDLDLRLPILKPPIEEGTEVFSVRWVDGYDDVPMRYETRFTIAYGFDLAIFVRRYYVLETLELVNNIVNDFAHRILEFG